MFGDALDLQVFDTDGDGNRRDDWVKLRDIVAGARPTYIEPISQSGEGHVHADWRSLRLELGENC